MNHNNNRPIWMEKQGRFQLSLWRKPDESGIQKEKYSFCIQHGYFRDGTWHNKRIWCTVKDLTKLSACLKAFTSLAAKKNPTDAFNSESGESESASFLPKSHETDRDQRTLIGNSSDDDVPIKLLETIGHIKRCIARFPELGVWWNRQDVEIDMDAILMSYGLRSNDFDPDERNYLRRQLIILADLERNGGLLYGPRSQMGQTIVTEVTG